MTYLSDGGPLDVSEVSNKRDVGSLPGTAWKLSSHKPGAGVAALRDPDLGQLWQSDGLQPHVVDILFPRRTAVTVRIDSASRCRADPDSARIGLSRRDAGRLVHADKNRHQGRDVLCRLGRGVSPRPGTKQGLGTLSSVVFR